VADGSRNCRRRAAIRSGLRARPEQVPRQALQLAQPVPVRRHSEQRRSAACRDHQHRDHQDHGGRPDHRGHPDAHPAHRAREAFLREAFRRVPAQLRVAWRRTALQELRQAGLPEPESPREPDGQRGRLSRARVWQVLGRLAQLTAPVVRRPAARRARGVPDDLQEVSALSARRRAPEQPEASAVPGEQQPAAQVESDAAAGLLPAVAESVAAVQPQAVPAAQGVAAAEQLPEAAVQAAAGEQQLEAEVAAQQVVQPVVAEAQQQEVLPGAAEQHRAAVPSGGLLVEPWARPRVRAAQPARRRSTHPHSARARPVPRIA
jgi:hypothetical protein